MDHLQQCVMPEECVCELAGVIYRPGQQMKVGCEICVCERGRPQGCQPNADCSGMTVKVKRSLLLMKNMLSLLCKMLQRNS